MGTLSDCVVCLQWPGMVTLFDCVVCLQWPGMVTLSDCVVLAVARDGDTV